MGSKNQYALSDQKASILKASKAKANSTNQGPKMKKGLHPLLHPQYHWDKGEGQKGKPGPPKHPHKVDRLSHTTKGKKGN